MKVQRLAWGALAAAMLIASAGHALAVENFGRGVVAAVNKEGKTYVGWRLLKEDPADVAFNVYRSTAGGAPVKVNAAPVTATTNLIDDGAPLGQANEWFVRPVVGGTEQAPSDRTALPANTPAGNAFLIKFQGDYAANKVGLGDLDGDGVFDYVIKQPQGGLDPGTARISPDTYKVEAYNGRTGAFMWRYDLGWNMNMGVWWTPYIVSDFDGDGKAEVALKTADPAATYEASLSEKEGPATGFVLKGAEYCSILDGTTGKEITKIDWVERGDPSSWGDTRGNRVNRNQIGVAKLDGKTNSLLVLRGTYTQMFIRAYNLVDGKLVEQWKWTGEDETPTVRGQGSHGIHVYDFDGDGNDEIVEGSFKLDHKGKLAWRLTRADGSGMGHPDFVYPADIIPERPGIEMGYGYEARQEKNGICLVDGKTGEIIWGHPTPTTHIHDQGMLADIDPDSPGLELYGAEQDRSLGQWLYSARDGKVLRSDDFFGSITVSSFYWQDGPYKVFTPFSYGGQGSDFYDYKTKQAVGSFAGRIVAIADVLGDWREEVISAVDGGLQITTTTIPATTRHTNLMQDPLYRSEVAHVSMGYFYWPNPSKPLFP